jgi:hypothetical protein
MYGPNEVYTLSTGHFPDSFTEPANPTTFNYGSQLLFNGPDAAIEISGGKVTAYMHGTVSNNEAFLAHVDAYEHSILKGVTRLRGSIDNKVVLAGVWYHVEFNERPRFEAYIVHVITPGGKVSSTPYREDLFDHDSPGEGMTGGRRIIADDAAEAIDALEAYTEQLVKLDEQWPSNSGLKPIQGIIWFPVDSSAEDAPIVVIRAMGWKAYARKGAEQPDDLARSTMLSALTNAETDNIISAELSLAVKHVARQTTGPHEQAIQGDNRVWALRQLRQTPFGFHNENVVLRRVAKQPLSLSEMANTTPATGYWSQIRYNCGGEDAPLFHAFDDDDLMATSRFADIVLSPLDVKDDATECVFGSDWVKASGDNVQIRLLAKGREPTLSW